MLNFISFGSGSSGNCYLLYTEKDALLIDLGIGTRALRKYFREYGLPLARVKHILVTHDHADHVKSVGKISHDLELPVIATVDVHKGIDRNYDGTNHLEGYRKVIPAQDVRWTYQIPQNEIQENDLISEEDQNP